MPPKKKTINGKKRETKSRTGTKVTNYVQKKLKENTPGFLHEPIDLAREVWHDLTGFSERDVNAGVQADMAKSQMPAETGGTVVTTQEAPVAFPRRPEGVSARRASVGGRDFFHIHDLTNPVNTGPSANTFHISYELGVNPGASAATFP